MGNRIDPLLLYVRTTLKIDWVAKLDGIVMVLEGLPNGDQLGELIFVDRCG